jgi:hypothetical protein
MTDYDTYDLFAYLGYHARALKRPERKGIYLKDNQARFESIDPSAATVLRGLRPPVRGGWNRSAGNARALGGTRNSGGRRNCRLAKARYTCRSGAERKIQVVCRMNTSVFLGDVLTEIKCGIGAEWNKYPVLGATRGGVAPAKELPGKNPERYKPVFPGTIFYNPMRILIGSVAYVDEGNDPGITSPDYVVFQGKKGKVVSRWFYYWLRSPLGHQTIISLARGAVRERLLFTRLAEAEVELPDYPTQKDASLVLAQAQRVRDAITAQLFDLEQLPHRIVSQSFDGWK